MGVKLTIGLQKKVGLPDYGSLGACCHVELEIDRSLLESDLDGFHRKVNETFVACRQAVNDELARQQSDNTDPSSNRGPDGNGRSGRSFDNGSGYRNGNGRGVREATASQIRAIRAIAGRQRIDLQPLLQDRFGVARPDDLSISQASDLIDELKSSSGAGGGRR